MDAALISAIGSPRRREILRLLWDQERTAGAIHQAMPDVTFGAVSLQLKVLADAGLVESRADAQFRVYKVRREALGPVAAMLESMWTDALWHLKLKAELKESRRGPRPRRRSHANGASVLRRTPRQRKPPASKGKKR
jgi:DNA-binding transcriptional ArsR family regulator